MVARMLCFLILLATILSCRYIIGYDASSIYMYSNKFTVELLKNVSDEILKIHNVQCLRIEKGGDSAVRYYFRFKGEEYLIRIMPDGKAIFLIGPPDTYPEWLEQSFFEFFKKKGVPQESINVSKEKLVRPFFHG